MIGEDEGREQERLPQQINLATKDGVCDTNKKPKGKEQWLSARDDENCSVNTKQERLAHSAEMRTK